MIEPLSLLRVFEGWDEYNTNLVHAVEPLTIEHLRFKPVPTTRSVGEVASHIALGRIDWFRRMEAPGSVEVVADRYAWRYDQGRKATEETIAESAADIVHWRNRSWGMVERTLSEWTVDDLAKWYPHTYWCKTYEVSRQWTLWRIMAHDIQHGGQLTTMLAMFGIEPDEPTGLGGHLTELPLVSSMQE